MTRYQKLQSPNKQQEKKSIFSIVYNFLAFVTIGIMLVLIGVTITQRAANHIPKEKIAGATQSYFDLSKRKWNSNQTKNLLIVEEAAKYVNHPNPKRMGAHLLSESGATTFLDGDKGNGAFKKSYGIMQVKLGTVYYVRNKRPDLIKLYTPEVNTLPKEDILDKLRKDPYFNAKIASLTHIVLIDVCGDQNTATVAYNRGFCKADELGKLYLNKILQYEEEI